MPADPADGGFIFFHIFLDIGTCFRFGKRRIGIGSLNDTGIGYDVVLILTECQNIQNILIRNRFIDDRGSGFDFIIRTVYSAKVGIYGIINRKSGR